MNIRDITIEDYEKLISFWEANYFVSEMDSLEGFTLFLEKNPHLSILTEENGKIIGTVLGSFDGRRGYLQKLVVDKTFRKKGIGQQLVEEVLKRLHVIGTVYIPIAVEENLVDFYEKCGFKQTAQIPMSIELSSLF